MANIKFSAFTQKVVHTDVDFLVGYTGADNVRISPSVIGAGIYLPLSGGTMIGDVVFNDNVKARFGTGLDAYIQHTATNTEIINATGNLNIKSTATDGDITFYADDGGGGTTTYLTIDGGDERVNFAKNAGFADSVQILMGDGLDLRIKHDATDSYIQNFTGNLEITNNANDKDIIFRCDDGSGGLETYFFLDGSTGNTKFPDSKKLVFGDGSDLRILHDSSDSFINSDGAGDLYIQQFNDDKDIIFKSDDGSGGLATYFYLDGSLADGTYNYTRWNDGGVITFGGDQDLRIWHDPSNSSSYIRNYTNDLYIENTADDSDILFRCDDGSGGVATYFYLDGDAGGTDPVTRFPDNSYLKFGDAQDFSFVHTGTSYIQNFTGDLQIQNNADDKDILFRGDDGSGGLETYFYMDGSLVNGTSVKGATRFPDASKIYMGSGGDLEIFHNGSQAYIENYTSTMNITQHANDSYILFKCDDGAGGVTTYLTIEGSDEQVQFSKDAKFSDDVKLLIGNSSDLQIYHDGTHSRIVDSGAGNLTLNATDFALNNSGDTKNMITAYDGGTVNLYYDASQKFRTISVGVEVTGQINLAALNTAPASASAAGTLGEIRVTADYIYVCTATNTWKRSALSTW